ncbi:MAG: hypothetical protein KC505_02455 [Myxococcales bacterium]|nr:hypothetical protein [Myxococcales bacterium]USN50363.1 MAG: hypothetical protein H6731_08875 [Myxococcales bacterium]
MKKSTRFICWLLTSILMSSLSNLSYADFFSGTLTNTDYDKLERYVLRHLEEWCPDAWCSGDFQHTWESFKYNVDTQEWTLQFTSYQRFSENFELLPSNNFLGSIESNKFMAMRSSCTFPSKDPKAMLDFDTQGFLGLSYLMSEQLIICISAIEEKLTNP